MLEKIKLHSASIFFIIAVILIGTLGFGLGRLSKIEEGREPVKIARLSSTSDVENEVSSPAMLPASAKGPYVASRNGTKYYLTNCSGVSRIKEENKVYFATAAAARATGLTPATNCPGI